MIVNISNAPVVIGRFRILPGNKFPGVPKTYPQGKYAES